MKAGAPSRAHRLVCCAAALVATALCSACSRSDTPTGVVLIVVDALRADRLGSYGYGEDTSPNIDALALQGVRFNRAMAPSPWTLPSLATLMTGLPPVVHGAISMSPVHRGEWLSHPEEFLPVDSLHDSRTTLAEVLRQAGFATFAAVRGSYASAPFGIGQGFDRYDDNRTPGFRFDVANFLGWLDEEAPERFFAYLHVTAVHSPYQPPELTAHFLLNRPDAPKEEYARALEEEAALFEQFDPDPGYSGLVTGSRQSLNRMRRIGSKLSARNRLRLSQIYDRGIRYVDHWIGRLAESLAERGRAASTLMIITSDHGEELLDHGGLEHGHTFFEELLRVPLVVKGPGARTGHVLHALVSLEDVMPTVLDALEIPIPDSVMGRSLLPALAGEPVESRDAIGEASRMPGAIALRTSRQKLVRTARGRYWLFDLEFDPGEQNEICAERRTECHELVKQLQKYERQRFAQASELGLPAPDAADIDDAVAERLRALGYTVDANGDEQEAMGTSETAIDPAALGTD